MPSSSPATTTSSAYLSDTAFEELQTTRLESLAKARHGNHPIFPARRPHVHASIRSAEMGDVSDAAPGAIARNSKRMIDPPMGEYEGLPALRRFATEVGGGPRRSRTGNGARASTTR